MQFFTSLLINFSLSTLSHRGFSGTTNVDTYTNNPRATGISQGQYYLLTSRLQEIRTGIIGDGLNRIEQREDDARLAIGIIAGATVALSGLSALALEAATVFVSTTHMGAPFYASRFIPQSLGISFSGAGGGFGTGGGGQLLGVASTVPRLRILPSILARTPIAADLGSSTIRLALSPLRLIETFSILNITTGGAFSFVQKLVPISIVLGGALTLIDQLDIGRAGAEDRDYRLAREQEASYGLNRSLADNDSDDGISPEHLTMTRPLRR